jgi:long-subunit acyl-CoA synthetase (AMP-forming)
MVTMDVDQVAEEITRAVAGRTLVDALADNANRHGEVPALRWRQGDVWQTLTWRRYEEEIRYAALGLRAFGVRPGEHVGLLMANRPELAVADLALLHLRAVPVCLFESFTAEQLFTVLETLGIAVCIVDGDSQRERLAGRGLRVIALDDGSWDAVMASGRAADLGEFEACRREVRPDDIVAVNYTSGTTGSLKGVRHSHRNVVWHAESFARLLPLEPGTRFLSYLPRAHATERFVTTWFPLSRAGTVSLCAEPARLPEYLRDVRPQFFGGVLQVWEKLYAAAAESNLDSKALGLDECGFAFSGGGALAVSVQEFFHGLGVPLTEGWGQSELVSAATCAPPGRIRAGTAGVALPGVGVRVAADGELLVRSGSRMVGYTDPSKDIGDEWVRTGDLGEIDDEGYVRILGRREEVFRLSDGYPVPVTRIESQLRANPLVNQACVVGEGRADLSALLVVAAPPDRWNHADLERIVAQSNHHLPARERIARFTVISGVWEPGRAEELTHTGKLKRAVIAAKHPLP